MPEGKRNSSAAWGGQLLLHMRQSRLIQGGLTMPPKTKSNQKAEQKGQKAEKKLRKINLFMQNKPNFKTPKNTLSPYKASSYIKNQLALMVETNPIQTQSKPITKPIQSQLRAIKPITKPKQSQFRNEKAQNRKFSSTQAVKKQFLKAENFYIMIILSSIRIRGFFERELLC